MLSSLKNHFLTSSLNSIELEQFGSIAQKEVYKEDEIIFCERQPSDHFYILLKGKVTLYFSADTVIDVFPGHVFGDWAMLSDSMRLATAKANLQAEVISINYKKMLNPEFFPAHISLKIILILTKPIIGRLQSPALMASRILIDKGENQKVEFKETLRTNIHTGNKDDKMEFAVIKTLAGFLNSKGGVLFIGVRDDGFITGLAIDGFQNNDKLILFFGHLINAKLGKTAQQYIHVNSIYLDQKWVVRVDCSSSPEPVYLKDSNQLYFYVRQNAQTVSLNIKESVDYIKAHF